MARSSTTFKKGQPSANPSGRPPLTEAQRLANEFRTSIQPELARVLWGICKDSSAEAKDRIAAGKVLFTDTEPAKLEVSDTSERPLKGVTLEELRALLRG